MDRTGETWKNLIEPPGFDSEQIAAEWYVAKMNSLGFWENAQVESIEYIPEEGVFSIFVKDNHHDEKFFIMVTDDGMVYMCPDDGEHTSYDMLEMKEYMEEKIENAIKQEGWEYNTDTGRFE